jgi:ABC-type Mn2+/Zn2+ transport system ATPase subunit
LTEGDREAGGGTMAIKEIRIHKLFGLYDHVIPMYPPGIAVLYGENGVGKTVSMQLILGMLGKAGREALEEIEFERIEIEFEQGVLKVSPKDGFSFENEAGIKNWPLRQEEPGPRTIAKILERARNPKLPFAPIPEDLPQYLSELSASILPTERLEKNNLENFSLTKRAVSTCALDMTEAIAHIQAQYTLKAKELDRTFASRVLKKDQGATDTRPEVLTDLIHKNEATLSRLTNIGALTALEDSVPEVLKPSDLALLSEDERRVLAISALDIEQKLSVFNEFGQKLERFLQIINSRFRRKRLSVNGTEGLFVQDTLNRQVPLEALSSGEQHELVLFFDLLFRKKPGALVMIDEPELSLHVAWEEHFLDDILDVIRITGIQVIIATHSPDIISSHWDLTVELKGPQEQHQAAK